MNENSRNAAIGSHTDYHAPRCTLQFDSELERDLAVFARLNIEAASEFDRSAPFDKLSRQNDVIEVMNSDLRRRKLELEKSNAPDSRCALKETNVKIGMILIYFAARSKRDTPR